MTESNDQRRSVTELLVALAGPAIWFAHFGTAYSLQGFGCTIAGGTDPSGAVRAGVWAALILSSATAVLALALVLLLRYRRSTRDRSDANTQDEWSFLHYLQFAIAGLSLVAVLWTTLAVLLVPTCAPIFGN